MLQAAVGSVLTQTRPADQIRIGVDLERQGPAAVRNRLGLTVDTEWIAWLDDDDLLGPDHLQVCLDTAAESGADVVYPWFTVQGGTDPFPQHFGKPWDPAVPVQTTVTTLMRADWFRKVGGFAVQADSALMPDGNRAGEDFDLICRLNQAGARIVHAPVRTWTWNHWGGNTSGLSSRW